MPGIEDWNNGSAWNAYNDAARELWVQDNYPSAWNVINAQEMGADQAFQLAPTGESAYGYKNYANGATATWYSNYSSTVEYVPDVVNQIDSNASGATGSTQTTWYQSPADTDYSGGSGGGGFKGTDIKTGSGASFTGFLQNTVVPAVAAAGLGIKLGKVIDKTLYDLNPDFWDNNGMSSINPDTWDAITIDMSDSGIEGVLKRGFNAIFGLNPTSGTSQMYIDADAAAYLAMYMQQNHVFDTGESTAESDSLRPPSVTQPLNMGGTALCYETGYMTYPQYTYTPLVPNSAIFLYRGSSGGVVNRMEMIAASATQNAPVIHTLGRNYIDGSITQDQNQIATPSYSYAGKTVYYNVVGVDNKTVYCDVSNPMSTRGLSTDERGQVAWILVYGTIHESQPIEGITNQTGATLPDFSGATTLAEYLSKLYQQYPDLYNNKISQTVAQPDGTTTTHDYIPVGTPTYNINNDNRTYNQHQTITNPSETGQSQSDTQTDTTTATQTLLQTLVETLTKTFTPTGTPTDTTNPPDTGDGDTPTITTPTGQASALWSVYNPSQAQLNSFGAWLWSSSFIDQVLKLFNNPMQSIIGVHKIFATPATSGTGNITVGYLDSGVSANLVSNQYTDIDCGTVNVKEQFGNVFDYTDTHIRLYLPFIGIVDLDTADVMRGSVKVVYHVDVITGACLADVLITRDNSGGVLYQFAGDAAVRYPISSGSYIGVVSGIASAIGGVASAVMTGGATLPLAAGAIAGGIGSAKTNVQHSGNFSGNAGAMGAKKPYIIIERPQTMIATGFSEYQGAGANVRRTVGQMSGYFKFSDVHTESISKAAESEIEAIRAALESGVIA